MLLHVNLNLKYVHLPQTKDAIIEKASKFEAKYGMHQAFGCIDGFSVSMLKQFVTFFVSFVDVDCHWLGSVHDAKVLANSSFSQKLTLRKKCPYSELF